MKGRKSRNVTVALVVFILILGTYIGASQLSKYGPIREMLFEDRAHDAYNEVRKKEPKTYVTDNVIRVGYRYLSNSENIFVASFYARTELFEEQFCKHVFPVDEEESVEELCVTAMHGRSWYSSQSVPQEVIPIAQNAMRWIFRNMREYLSKPENLSALYFAKRDVLTDEFRQQSEEEQKAVINQIGRAIAIIQMVQFQESIRELYEEYRFASLMSKDTTDWNLRKDKEKAFKKLKKVIVSHLSNSANAQECVMMYLYFMRRQAEGGNDLLDAYRTVLLDFNDRV